MKRKKTPLRQQLYRIIAELMVTLEVAVEHMVHPEKRAQMKARLRQLEELYREGLG